MNDVAMPISPNSDQASTTDAGRTTSRTVWTSRSAAVAKGARFRSAGRQGSAVASRGGIGAGGDHGRASPGGDRPEAATRAAGLSIAGAEKAGCGGNAPARRAGCKTLSAICARPRRLARVLWEARARASGSGKTRPRPADPRAGDRSGRRGWLPRSRRGRPGTAGFGGESVEATWPDALPDRARLANRPEPANPGPEPPGRPCTGDRRRSSQPCRATRPGAGCIDSSGI